MAELALIVVSTVLVNNFVLVKFLGLCPFMGVSRKLETATGMALATTFVLTLSAVCSWMVQTWLLEPLEWETFQGVLIPSVASVTWQDQGTPWLVWEVEEVVYSVDVGEYIRARGP